MATTAIEWATDVWNPTTGCDRVSAGCDHCYALAMAKRLKGMGSAKYQRDGDPRTSGPGFGLTAHEDVLSLPLRWREPRRVFVNSMSDLFHSNVPDEFIARVFAAMAATPQHTYQILTKRYARMRSLLSSQRFRAEMENVMAGESIADRYYGLWPLPNLWGGVSVEDQKHAELRIPALLDTPLAVRFISADPLLGSIDLSKGDGITRNWLPDLDPGGSDSWYAQPITVCTGHGMPYPCGQGCAHLDWVIIGGESGPGFRPMNLEWAGSLVAQCRAAHVPVFVKQDSGPRSGSQGRLSDELWGTKEFPAPKFASDVEAGRSTDDV